MAQRREEIPSFGSLAKYLLETDRYMALADLDCYIQAQTRVGELYAQDQMAWQRMSLLNIAGAGIFCADRAIEDYARDIWGL